MSRALREALRFVESIAVLSYFLRHVQMEDFDGGGCAAALESLMQIEAATPAAWRALARVARHVISALEDRGDARVLLLYELRDELMVRVDQAAASGRQNGGDA